MNAIRCLFTLFLTYVVVIGKKNGNRESGPFRSVLVNVSACDHTTYPPENEPLIQLFVQAYPGRGTKYNLLRGNITVVRETRQLKVKLKSFAWEDGKWKLTYLINGISCKGMLMDLLTRAIKFDMYDGKKCAFLKGNFIFQDLDINTMQHIWTSKMEYGRILWRSEITVGTALYSCLNYETMVERA